MMELIVEVFVLISIIEEEQKLIKTADNSRIRASGK